MGKPAVNDKHLLKRDDGVIHGSLSTFQLSHRQRTYTRWDSNFNPKFLPRCQLQQQFDPCLAREFATTGGEAIPPTSPVAVVAEMRPLVLGCPACGEFGVVRPEHQ